MTDYEGQLVENRSESLHSGARRLCIHSTNLSHRRKKQNNPKDAFIAPQGYYSIDAHFYILLNIFTIQTSPDEDASGSYV